MANNIVAMVDSILQEDSINSIYIEPQFCIGVQFNLELVDRVKVPIVKNKTTLVMVDLNELQVCSKSCKSLNHLVKFYPKLATQQTMLRKSLIGLAG